MAKYSLILGLLLLGSQIDAMTNDTASTAKKENDKSSEAAPAKKCVRSYNVSKSNVVATVIAATAKKS